MALEYLRRLAVCAEVVRSDRKLDRIDAESLIRQIAADPNVEYVQVDALMQPLMTPNDNRYGDQWHYFEATVESQLKSTACALPGTCSGGCGAGIVNASAAVDAALGTAPPPSTLSNGVTVSNLSASTGNSLSYTMSVPSGASNLTFAMSDGTGDADLYVKFGSAPTDTVYDCRPYLSGNAETCSFTTPQVGTCHVRMKAYSSFSGVSLTGGYSTGAAAQTYTNTTDYTIIDNTTVDSPITVSGRSGNAPSATSVAVNIVHTCIGDLKVDLIAPDGSLYNLHNRTGTSTGNIVRTCTVNLSTEALNGTWKLRVNDNAAGDTGYINSWSVTF